MTIMDSSPVAAGDTELAVRLHSIIVGLDLENPAHRAALVDLAGAASFLPIRTPADRYAPTSVNAPGDTRRLLDDLESLPVGIRRSAPTAAILTRVRFAADRLGVR